MHNAHLVFACTVSLGYALAAGLALPRLLDRLCGPLRPSGQRRANHTIAPTAG